MSKQPPVLYKVLRYSTTNSKGVTNNFDQPKKVERELNNLALDGYEVYWAWNIEKHVVLLLAKDTGELSPREVSAEKLRQVGLRDIDFNRRPR